MNKRCPWAGTDPAYIAYHDTEWGVPVHEDQRLFEFLTLEGAQAGLSWITILRMREAYRLDFEGFEPARVARFDDKMVSRLLSNPGIVRNRLKINSAVGNARAFLKLQEEFGSFDTYLWGFVGGQTLQNAWSDMSQVPTTTKTAEALAKDLSRRGFKFVGATICYALMQAVGMVNDHLVSCPRHRELGGGAALST